MLKIDTVSNNAPNQPGARVSYTSNLEDRLHNWRRFYRVAQKYHCTSYYTPPDAGEVMQEDRIIKLPVNMQDAILLEKTWREIQDPAKKWYLKWQYIARMNPNAIWRKLKQYNVRIRNNHEYASYNRLVLEHFEKLLGG